MNKQSSCWRGPKEQISSSRKKHSTGLIELFTVHFQDISDENPNACKYLLGVRDEDIENTERQILDLVTIGEDVVTCGLMTLLSMRDPNHSVYQVAAERMKWIFRSSDYTAQTPLETIIHLGPLLQIHCYVDSDL